jgi:uncharacterized protein YcfJ
MNKAMIGGVLIGVALATSGAVVAGFASRDSRYAQVLDVQAVSQDVRLPRQVCTDESVQKQRPVEDQHRLAGTAIGALVGGVLGHQVGGGNGRSLATVAGAAAGGYAGNRTQQHLQERDTVATMERRCHTVQDVQHEVVGYDVRYRLGDSVDVVRMKQRPGDRIPVRDGQLVLEQGGAQSR